MIFPEKLFRRRNFQGELPRRIKNPSVSVFRDERESSAVPLCFTAGADNPALRALVSVCNGTSRPSLLALLWQRELRGQFKAGRCRLAPSGGSLKRLPSTLPRHRFILTFLILRAEYRFVKPLCTKFILRQRRRVRMWVGCCK